MCLHASVKTEAFLTALLSVSMHSKSAIAPFDILYK